MPKLLDQESPNDMPPMAMGETFTEAVGERIRCQPSGFVGLGIGSNGSGAVDIVSGKISANTVFDELKKQVRRNILDVSLTSCLYSIAYDIYFCCTVMQQKLSADLSADTADGPRSTFGKCQDLSATGTYMST